MSLEGSRGKAHSCACLQCFEWMGWGLLIQSCLLAQAAEGALTLRLAALLALAALHMLSAARSLLLSLMCVALLRLPAAVERGTVRLCTDESGRLAVAMVNPLGAEPSTKAGSNGGSSTLQPNGSGESSSGSTSSESSSSSGGSGGGTDGKINGSAPAAGAAAAAAGAAAAEGAAEASKQPIRLVLAYVTLPDGSGASGSGKAIADVRLDSAQRVAGELEKHGLQPLPPGQVTQQQLEATMPAVMWGGSQVRFCWGRLFVW